MDIGYAVRKARKKAGLSVRDLATATGITRGYISELENGKKTNPSQDLIQRIAKECGVTAISIYTAALRKNKVNL